MNKQKSIQTVQYKKDPNSSRLIPVVGPVGLVDTTPAKIIHTVDEVHFLNQNPNIEETPRSFVSVEASESMPAGGTYSLQLPTTQGSAGEVLENDGTGQLEWKVGGGSGDVVYTGVNPVPTTRQFAVYDGTTGTEIKDSGVTAPAAASGIAGDVLTLNTPTDAVWTAPIVGVTGIPPSLPGNLSQFDNLVADQISDSGVKASEVILNPSGVPLLGGTLAQFDTGPTTITDSGIPVASVGTVIGVPPTSVGHLSEWTDVTATQLADSVVVAAEVVQNPSGVGVNGNLAQFGATPEEITDSGVAVLDVGDVKSSTIPSVNNTITVYDSTTGKLIKAGGVVTVVGDEIATTSTGITSTIVISSGIPIFPTFSYGSMRLNYTPSIYPPGGAVSVGLITAGPNIGQLTNIPVPPNTSFGQMYFNTGLAGPITTVISVAGTWVNIAGPVGGYTTSPGNFFTFANVGTATQMTYTGTSAVNVKATCSVCWEIVTGGSSDFAQIAFTVNGTIQNQTILDSTLDNPSIAYPRNACCQGIISLTPGDVVGIQVRNLTDTSNFAFAGLTLNIHSI